MSDRTVAKGAPNSDLEAAAMESTTEPTNPQTGESIKDNYPRAKANFINRQFQGKPDISGFKGVRVPTKQEVDQAAQFQQFKAKSEKTASEVDSIARWPKGTRIKGKAVGGQYKPSGTKTLVTKTGAVQVRQKGRIVTTLKEGFRGPDGRFTRPKSPTVTVEDRDAFDASVREAAKREGDSFVGNRSGASSKQVDLFQDAINESLGL